MYVVPATMPALVPSVLGASRPATTGMFVGNSGITVSAVSVFSVLAGASLACAPFAASTSPVSASATTNDVAVMPGNAGTPGGRVDRDPGLPECRAADRDVVGERAAGRRREAHRPDQGASERRGNSTAAAATMPQS